jgi:hypothetical protein|tara:strand:+ start:688 stop:987 length:300 start_codon:yes stop_codon:yes gene_type:complete
MKRTYKEQKQLLKETLQQVKTKELIDKEYVRNERERLLKKEVERIFDAFRLLVAILLLPLLTILSVVPLTALLVLLCLFIMKEMLLGMFRLTILPFKKL